MDARVYIKVIRGIVNIFHNFSYIYTEPIGTFHKQKKNINRP